MVKWLCRLNGHRLYRQVRGWFVTPRYRSLHVADEVVEEQSRCFCGVNKSGWEEIDRSGINSLSMSSEKWALLRRDGKVATG